MKTLSKLVLIGMTLATVACSRVETGQVAIVRNFDKTIDMQEAMPGNTVWTVTQDAIDAQTKDISVDVKDLRPLASDNSTLDDFDLTVIYSVNPNMAAELYVNKSSSFHTVSQERDLFLMYNYVYQLARNAAIKAVDGVILNRVGRLI